MYKKLRVKIFEKFRTVGAFAEKIGVSRASVSNKLNGKTGFTKSDILLWSAALDIPQECYLMYFFGEEMKDV